MIDKIKYPLHYLRHRKLRSILSILSITIGIMAIITLVSFGIGIQEYVNSVAEEAGVDKLFVMAKGMSAPGMDENFALTESDINFLSRIKGVKDVTGLYMKGGEIKHGKEKKNNFIVGIDASKSRFIEEVFTVGIFKGRMLKESDTNKAVLGYNYQFENEIFKKAIALGDRIEVKGKQVEVIGFLEEVGNPQDDANVLLNYRTMESIFDVDTFGYAVIKSDSLNNKELAERIKEKLRKHKGQEEGKEDFYVQTLEDMLATFGSIISVINAVLVLIAFVSLIVASVNIMNTMYTAVLERTKEIGVMKAIGAKNADIMLIFIFESGVLGLVGGIIGVILGYGAASYGGYVAASAGYSLLKPSFPLYLIVWCILFAFVVGALSGFLPARQAAKLKPVDALRYE